STGPSPADYRGLLLLVQPFQNFSKPSRRIRSFVLPDAIVTKCVYSSKSVIAQGQFCYNHYNMLISTQGRKSVTTIQPKELYTVRDDNDLDLHKAYTFHATHRMHSFGAKFPPQLADWAITHFSEQGETVLDPMAGSGTTLQRQSG
ncbi:MAG: site-specific DNA-methyltransferase, partial [Sandaracinaceae bacterium]|nr:site-specific DNA-methyltransferase [Sandaracinaceae bacterium]